jgi:excisionase family DNA binding protein
MMFIDRRVKMLTKKELAAKLKLSIPTIDRLMKKGMPFFKIGKSVRFDEEIVNEWLKKYQKGE